MCETTIDEARLEQLMGRALGDIGATITAPRMVSGDKLEPHRGMAGAGPLTAPDGTERTDPAELIVDARP